MNVILCWEITASYFKLEDAKAKASAMTSRDEIMSKPDRYIDDEKQYGGIPASSVHLSLQNHGWQTDNQSYYDANYIE